MTRWRDDGGRPGGAVLLDRLRDGVLVADGAMGTQIYERGVFINRCFDELCLSAPDMIRDIHAKAGAFA